MRPVRSCKAANAGSAPTLELAVGVSDLILSTSDSI
ncbi:Uncharacterised protein [Mycobacteroides abscessus subsp. abscessus]|nr:Uncharacterised protein [Mycobacteroides abscessus subsp. abscessus]